MESDKELERLRRIGEWMREVGATELTLGDLRIVLGPAPSVVAAAAPRAAARDADERAALDEEERKLVAMSDAEREHYLYWRRLTRSSGAPIPPFRPKQSRPA